MEHALFCGCDFGWCSRWSRADLRTVTPKRTIISTQPHHPRHQQRIGAACRGACRISCARRRLSSSDNNLSPKMMANWVFAPDHSRGARFQSWAACVVEQQVQQLHRGIVTGEVPPGADGAAQPGVQRLNRVRNRNENGGVDVRLQRFELRCMERPSGTEEPVARRCGQAVLHSELRAHIRARVSGWPPLRLARLRRELGSAGVVSPAASVWVRETFPWQRDRRAS